ncbi:MAG: hypothetical protein IIW55_08235 [Bacteroidales bacterium]|nr:hypothetical protein [Bacteroidales bacterium]
MIKHIKPLPISEEILGAYLEGNLSQNDAQYVEQMLHDNDELSAFVNELAVSDNLISNYLMEDIPSFENDFALPEIATEIGTFIEPHILPFGFEPSFADVAVCAMMPDITDDGDMIINDNQTNIDIDNISDIGVDINSEALPTDGE